LPDGLILKGIGGFYYIESYGVVYECKARGIFRKNEVTPLPGDRVDFSIIDKDTQKGNIDKILERTTQLTRPAVSNVDQVVIVVAVRSPLPDLLLVDKLLVSAAKEGVKPLICLNKQDLDVDGECGKIKAVYENAGYEVIITSSKTGDGIGDLEERLKSRITVFSGQSGVGKSTLLNAVLKDMVMQTGGLSEKTDRGKHTTRHAELIPLFGGGYLIDTPGFSSFELEAILPEQLKDFYHEFDKLNEQCRFSGCNHLNEPDCKVKRNVTEGSIDKGRYGRYVEIFNILKQLNDTRYKK